MASSRAGSLAISKKSPPYAKKRAAGSVGRLVSSVRSSCTLPHLDRAGRPIRSSGESRSLRRSPSPRLTGWRFGVSHGPCHDAAGLPLAKPAVEVDQDALCILRTPDGTGTGFVFLKPAWVLTAKHVVLRPDGTARPVTALFRSGPIEAELRFAHPLVDLAVLELRALGKCRAPFLPGDRRIRKTGGLRCGGYSPSVSNPQEGRFSYYVSGIHNFERSTRNRDGHEEVVLEFPAAQGDGGHSGGPVFGDGGAVVAVVTEGFVKETVKHMRAISVHSLLEYLTFPGWAAKGATS
jgi:S1-C subfamily serine protease